MSELINVNLFKSPEANKRFFYWINNEPEDDRASDFHLFIEMIVALYDSNEELSFDKIRAYNSKISDDKIYLWMDRYRMFQKLYEELKPRFNKDIQAE